MAHAVETMFSGMGLVPWHGLGNVVDGVLTAEEAIIQAGLDWHVVKRPLLIENNAATDTLIVPEHYAIVRTDRDHDNVLGMAKGRYTPLQNKDAFGFFDRVVSNKEAIYHTAGSLHGGKRIWILAKLPGEIIAKGDDITDKYLLLTNGHDGNSAVEVKFVATRVVCQNTLTAAIGEQGTSLKIRHTINMNHRFDQAIEVLGIANKFYEELQSAVSLLTEKQLTSNQIDTYITKVLGGDDKRAKDKILDLVESGMGADLPGVRGTAWGAYNAVTEYLTHGAHYKNVDTKMDSLWFKGASVISEKAFDLALAI